MKGRIKNMLTEKEKYVVLKILADGKPHGLQELCSAIQRKVFIRDISQATFVRWVFGKDDFMFQVDGALHQQSIIHKIKDYENKGSF